MGHEMSHSKSVCPYGAHSAGGSLALQLKVMQFLGLWQSHEPAAVLIHGELAEEGKVVKLGSWQVGMHWWANSTSSRRSGLVPGMHSRRTPGQGHS